MIMQMAQSKERNQRNTIKETQSKKQHSRKGVSDIHAPRTIKCVWLALSHCSSSSSSSGGGEAGGGNGGLGSGMGSSPLEAAAWPGTLAILITTLYVRKRAPRQECARKLCASVYVHVCVHPCVRLHFHEHIEMQSKN